MKEFPFKGMFIATIAIGGVLSLLQPVQIYQEAQAQAATANANVIVFVHVINNDTGTKQASDFQFQLATGSHGRVCNPQATYTDRAQFNGSETGTNITVSAPTCFYVAENVNDVPGYSVTASPCDQPRPIKPHHTATCSFTYDDLPTTPVRK